MIEVGVMLAAGNHTQENYCKTKKKELTSHLSILFLKLCSLRCFSLTHSSMIIIIASFII